MRRIAVDFKCFHTQTIAKNSNLIAMMKKNAKILVAVKKNCEMYDGVNNVKLDKKVNYFSQRNFINDDVLYRQLPKKIL